ncbi:MAG: hypothetical protein P8Y71_03305 [Pseudolabrys sp.]
MSSPLGSAPRALASVLAPAVLLALLPAAVAAAERYERPPSFNAAQIRGIRRVGTNYTIVNPVHSDGLLRIYRVTTPYGKFRVDGDQMMRMRQNELYALARLEKVSNSKSFGQALAKAGLSPLMFAGKLISNPVGTVQNTFAGVGAFFGRLGSGMANAGKTRDDAMSDILGVTDERRHLAAAYGVDPYTDFPPLAAKLNQLSQAAAMGGLVVAGAMFAIPGGVAALVVSNLSTANQLNDIGIEDLARKYTAAQILDINRGLLAKLGVDKRTSERFLRNRNFTPIDQAITVAAIDSMRGVRDRRVFFSWAANANSRALAYVMRRQAELMADDYHKHRNYVRFVALSNYPYVITRDNRVMAILPVDALSWTPETAAGFKGVTAQRRRIASKARGVMRITGMATHLAKRELKRQGWTVLEHQRP